MADYVVSPATRRDLVEIPKIELAAAQLFPVEDLPPSVAATPTSYAAIRRACDQRRLWVARVDARVVGFVMGSFKDGLPHVREVDVLPEFGQRGIGSALMREVIAWARGKHARFLTLTTFRHLPYNAPFYARLGFTEIAGHEQGPELRKQLLDEAHRGVDPAKRVAMRLCL